MKQRELTEEEIDLLYDYHGEHYCQSDDVDKEEARAERWIESLTNEEINKILCPKKEKTDTE